MNEVIIEYRTEGLEENSTIGMILLLEAIDVFIHKFTDGSLEN